MPNTLKVVFLHYLITQCTVTGFLRYTSSIRFFCQNKLLENKRPVLNKPQSLLCSLLEEKEEAFKIAS